MKQGLTPTVFALVCASFLATACDKRDNAVTPPMPQTKPGTTSPTSPPMTAPGGSMGGTGSSDAASAPGMGGSK